MATELLELTVRYSCDECGDEFTIDYSDSAEIEDSPEHDDCPAVCGDCGCVCADCVCEDEECGDCGCGEDEETEDE